MANNVQKNAKRKINITAKIHPDLRAVLEDCAEKEDRSVSYIINRLLASHPALKEQLKKSPALQP